MAKLTKVLAIVIHTTATRPVQVLTMATLRNWHRARGFSDVGYHRVIFRNGKVFTGRKIDEQGAGVQGWNRVTYHISLEGGLNNRTAKPENNYTEEQFRLLELEVRTALALYPNAVILGHRDLSPDIDGDGTVEKQEWLKECPCFDAGAWAKSRGLPGGRLTRGKLVKL